MGVKSIKVPQPEFSNWIIQRRQEIGLSPAGLSEKLNGRLSERTLKYLEDGKRESFSEYTLTILAQGLELDYPKLLQQIEKLNPNHRPNGGLAAIPGKKKMASLLLTAVITAIITMALFKGFIFNKTSELSADTPELQNVLIHPDYTQMLVAYDGQGKTLWQKNLKTRVRKVEIWDLDQNGSKEVIAATYKNGLGDWGEHPGRLFVWNAQGEPVTAYNLWRPSIYPDDEPEINIRDFQITDFEKDGKLDIVVATAGVEYYPSRLAVLHFQDSTFTEVKTYWQPGYLSSLLIEDINGDGFPDIFCTAANNDFKRVPAFGTDKPHLRSMFLLDGRWIYGQAPPYLGDAPHGSQIWYRYVVTPDGQKRGADIEVTVMGEREKEIHVRLGDSCFFYFNYDGEIVGRFPGDHCRFKSEVNLVPNEKRW